MIIFEQKKNETYRVIKDGKCVGLIHHPKDLRDKMGQCLIDSLWQFNNDGPENRRSTVFHNVAAQFGETYNP